MIRPCVTRCYSTYSTTLRFNASTNTPRNILCSTVKSTKRGLGITLVIRLDLFIIKTEIDGLYIGDASVIPMSPGKPPILLILALALRLANHLIEEVI